MRFLSKTNAGLTVLILGLTAITVLPAQAQNRDYNSNYNRGQNQAPMPPRVEFQGQPRWMNVPGTNVQMISAGQRPSYDLFRMGSSYYIYDSGYWYSSNRWNGSYTSIDQRYVPSDFMNVPREYWRDYPATWANQTGNGNNNYYNRGQNQGPTSPSVTFRRQPRWIRVAGTNVLMTSAQQRPSYDLFKLGSTYYIHDNGYWYRSNRWNGTYTAIDQRYVPAEFMSVPRQYWRNYPEAWATRTDNGNHYGQYKRNHRGGNGN
jgi:hypothetical protein